MGFDEGQIVLNSDNGTYFPGQMLYGRLEFDLNKDKKFRGIYAEIEGKCKVHWTTSHTRRVNDRTEHYTVTHESYEDYMNVTVYLIGSKSGEQVLHPGRHVFPFECLIPAHCPSSYEGSNGSIRYTVKVTVDRAFKLDQTKQASFRVEAPLDLNTIPDAKQPIAFEFEQTFCCWCMNAGLSETIVKLPASGFIPKQIMPIEVACNNNSNVEIDTIKFSLKKNVTFEAQREPDTRYSEEVIAEIKKGPIPGNTTRNYTVEMEVPDMDAPNLNTCRFISIDYRFKVEIGTSGCHTDEDESRRVFIGTIPLASLQYPPNSNFETVNNTPGVTSYPPPPVINQPLANGAPYPGANPPYPGANPPYPGNTPSLGFTAENPPYPAPSPYPVGGNPPYPAGNVGANPSYPAGNVVANPPYPAGNVGANLPYPAGNGNPSLVTSQHVNSAAPYPNSGRTSPYPPNIGQTFGHTHNPASPNVGSRPPYPASPNVGSHPSYPASPNVGSHPPYPASPNVGSHPPYPASPNVGSHPPYPASPNVGSNPPYPTTPNAETNQQSDSNYSSKNSPYPSTPVVTGLKTGTIGFTSTGPKETMPLLPLGAMPLPTSPYASASAPPSTPDDENKKLAGNIPPYPQ